MFHLLPYYASQTAGASLADMNAIVDPSFSQRNNHFIFTEDYQIDAISAWGASLTRVQIVDATFTAINVPQIYPVNLAVSPPNNPIVQDMRQWPIGMPLNEEIAIQSSNNASIYADPEFVLMWISPKGMGKEVPMPQGPYGNYGRVRALASITAATTLGAWSNDVALTLNQQLKGGTYCIAGAYVICANALAFRINFLRAPLYKGSRKLYPGGLCEAAYGNFPLMYGDQWMGPFGYFDTFELPQIALLGNATAGSATYTVILDLIYMSQNMLANQPFNS